LIAGFSSTLAVAADGDPFAEYHQAIEQRLASMSEKGSPAPQRIPAIAGPLQRPATSVASGASVGSRSDFARKFWNGRDAEVSAALSRLERYRPLLEGILQQEGVPKNLVAVVLVESGAQPLALSPKQARGLWQFVPTTARRYGLTVTAANDDRVHVELATRAAARYLRDLYTRFGDWALALAAYNAGPEAVERAMRRGRVSTYSQLSSARLLPEETRNYVPAVFSAMDLLAAERWIDPPLENQPGANVLYAKILYAPAFP
jgi:soluble lytic murein transglycosylase-like protein